MINATFGFDSGPVPLVDSDLVVSDAIVLDTECVYV